MNYLVVKMSRALYWLVAGLAVFALATVPARAEAGETLVLLDNLAIRETHSIFFKNLQGKKKPICDVSRAGLVAGLFSENTLFSN